MKKTVCIILLLAIVWFPAIVNASDEVTMYATDGRTINVPAENVELWKNVGWYDSPMTTVYALDGRQLVIPQTTLNDWLQVGWYSEPVMLVYAGDGRNQIIPKADLQEWKNAGWFDYPVTLMYAPDGRKEYVHCDNVSQWESVGWYRYPVCYVYAIDGRVQIIPKSDVAAWVAVGWYESNEVTMYNIYGESQTVSLWHVPLWQNSGWYREPVYQLSGKVFTKTQVEYGAVVSIEEAEKIASDFCKTHLPMSESTMREYVGYYFNSLSEVKKEVYNTELLDFNSKYYLISVSYIEYYEAISIDKQTGVAKYCGGGQDYSPSWGWID